jgi:hypothetical protein
MVLENLVEEIRRIPGCDDAADRLSDLIAEQQNEDFLTALTWIAMRPRTVVEKLDAIQRLIRLPGPLIVSMRELTGWQ